MKKFIKNNIFGFVLGVIICSLVMTVYAISSNSVVFEPDDENWSASTVNEALNDLYSEYGVTASSFGTPIYGYYQGNSDPNNTASITLANGKYILVLVYQHTWAGGTYTNTFAENQTYTDFVFNYNSSNCSVTKLSSYYNRYKPTNNTNYLVDNTLTYFVDVNSSSETISTSISTVISANDHGEFLGIQAIPVK